MEQPSRTEPTVSVRNVFKSVYRMLYSKVLGIVVILAMAALALVGTMLMQAPMSKRHDPEGYAQWLQTADQKYGIWSKLFDFLGFYNLWTSPLFLAVTFLLGLSIVACTLHRMPVIWRKSMRPRTKVSDRFFEHAQYRAQIPVSVDPATAEEIMRSAMRKCHFRVLPAKEHSVYADKNRFGPFGTAIAHASFVIILLAFAVSGNTGFEETIEAPVNTPKPVGGNTGLTLTATSFKDSYDKDGHPLDYVSHLVVSEGDRVRGQQDVRVNSPLVVDGVRFHQSSFGIAAVVNVKKDGHEVFAGAIPLKYSDDEQTKAIGRVDLEKEDLQIIPVTAASGRPSPEIAPGTALVELYRLSTGEPLAHEVITQGKTAKLEGYDVTFDREQTYTGILVREDPGTTWMWVGSALLIIGMLMTFGMRHRRLWGRVSARSDGAVIHLASVDTLDTVYERQFRQLVHDIDQAAARKAENQ
ncbi:cytochrome c biogenesis protein ResB [Gleimia hominis]|uniref:Cytochrome c biogenesis protein ResB n=1 Tax=Gleimia hominis TaxID=595468 RepID=A0ABU3ICA1_9ACTO|nr:cytochrome c biogenesis protein ResB [Gleimia hominis]MDT3768002.1 cytochrome c biogenesis protein ResB [Gleimia hominis]